MAGQLIRSGTHKEVLDIDSLKFAARHWRLRIKQSALQIEGISDEEGDWLKVSGQNLMCPCCE